MLECESEEERVWNAEIAGDLEIVSDRIFAAVVARVGRRSTPINTDFGMNP